MENNLFRKKSLEHISSPEQLHDYMRVTSPRLWMILSAVVVLLIGFIIFACTTHMENTRSLIFQVESGWISSLVSSEDMDVIKIHMPVRIHGKTGKVSHLNLNTMIRVNIRYDDSIAPKDGFYEISFPDDPAFINEESLPGLLTVSNGVSLLYNDAKLMDYLTTDRRILVDGKLGTLTEAIYYDVASIAVDLDDPKDPLSDGLYEGVIVTESTTPINFLLN